MRLKVRLFAVLRERSGLPIIECELPAPEISQDELKALIAEVCPSLAPLLPIVRVVVNEAFLLANERIKAGDDVALIPPVSGGSGSSADPGAGSVAADAPVGGASFDESPLIALQSTPIDPDEILRAVQRPSAGAVVSFLGTVRSSTDSHDVVALEYEAYERMALRILHLISTETQALWPSVTVAIVHRIGRLEVAEISVAIAVSSPHRDEAFLACRHVIERLKQDVPIWKKELRSDGSVWVGVGS